MSESYFHCVLCQMAFPGRSNLATQHMRQEHFAVPMTIDIWPALITKRQIKQLRIPVAEQAQP
jgi:hypothetical protein